MRSCASILCGPLALTSCSISSLIYLLCTLQLEVQCLYCSPFFVHSLHMSQLSQSLSLQELIDTLPQSFYQSYHCLLYPSWFCLLTYRTFSFLLSSVFFHLSLHCPAFSTITQSATHMVLYKILLIFSNMSFLHICWRCH